MAEKSRGESCMLDNFVKKIKFIAIEDFLKLQLLGKAR
jgi:hypothetical protein